MLSYFQKYKLIIQWWIGKRVDVDKKYNYQCVDFIRQYCTESGYPITTSGNAIDLWKVGLWPKYKRISYKFWVLPSPGDVVIFNWPSIHWHIAIVSTDSTATVLNVIEQNWATWNWSGVGGDAIRKKSYPYTRVLWFFTHI